MAVQTKGLDLETRIDRLETQFELHRLVSEYCHGCDKKDIDRFLAIWRETRLGDLHGRLERRDGRWGITRRDVVIHYFSPVPGVDLAPPPPMP